MMSEPKRQLAPAPALRPGGAGGGAPPAAAGRSLPLLWMLLFPAPAPAASIYPHRASRYRRALRHNGEKRQTRISE